jgi:crotonobetainyl-CoA:carnitine CoA-transferase CaiB-like acyl-CoA transferase
VSLFDAGVAALVNQAANHLLGGIVPRPMGNAHPNIVPYQLFRTKDRPIVIAAGNDRLFERSCEVLGVPELATDERYTTNEARVLHRHELIELFSKRLATRSASEWIIELEAAGVPCALVRTVEEVFASPEGVATIQEVDDPVRGPLQLVAEPIRLDDVTPPARLPPPTLGEHTDEVLRELRELEG